MEIDLTGKVCIVTAAGRGIGKAIAANFAEAHAAVVINDIDLEAATQVSDLIESGGSRTRAIKADVAVAEDVNRLTAETLQTFGRIDILVNNAGVITRKPAEEITEAEWDRIIDVNLKGTFLCSQAVARHMIARRQGGKIINISSIMGNVALPPRSAYCASKGGIVMLTKDLAAEWAEHNIHVNAIAPGWTLTEMTQSYFAQDDVRRFLLERTPLKRFATPRDIAHTALFLASDLADYITGQTIHVDGGWTIL
ncbi:MAG: 3-oxoacyl-ACP reductase FabG [Desulfobacterales bacterium]|nr:MAG: 3-oxoacyl-ACP reductase FabG [Desulfobacterales bacterium]